MTACYPGGSQRLFTMLGLIAYGLPFLIVVSMPGWKSLYGSASVVVASLAYSWFIDGGGYFGSGPLVVAFVAATAALTARWLLLTTELQAFSRAGLAIIAAFFFGPLTFMYLFAYLIA